MLEINSIPARSLQKSYKAIIERVKTKKQPVVLTRNNKPQAAIIALEDLKYIDRKRDKKSAQILLELANLAEKYSKKGSVTDAVKDTKTVWDSI